MYTIWTRREGDPNWSKYADRPDLASALVEFQWAVADPRLYPERNDPDRGPWQVQVRGPSGAVRHYYSSDGLHAGALLRSGLRLSALDAVNLTDGRSFPHG